MVLPIQAGQHLRDGLRTGVVTDPHAANTPGVLNHGYRAYQIQPNGYDPIAVALPQTPQSTSGIIELTTYPDPAIADVPRGIVCTLSANATGTFTVIIAGIDDLGRNLIEHLLFEAGVQTVKGKKAFKQVSYALFDPGSQSTVTLSLGWSNVFGLPYYIHDEGAVLLRFNQPKTLPKEADNYESGSVNLVNGIGFYNIKNPNSKAAVATYNLDGASFLVDTGTLSVEINTEGNLLTIYSSNSNDNNLVNFMIAQGTDAYGIFTLQNGVSTESYNTGEHTYIITYLSNDATPLTDAGELHIEESSPQSKAVSSNPNDSNSVYLIPALNPANPPNIGGPIQLSSGIATVPNSLVVQGTTAVASYYKSVNALPPPATQLPDTGTLAVDTSIPGTLTITSSNSNDDNVICWLIDQVDNEPINWANWFPIITPGDTRTATPITGDTRGTFEIPDVVDFTTPNPVTIGSIVNGERWFFAHMQIFGIEDNDKNQEDLEGVNQYA